MYLKHWWSQNCWNSFIWARKNVLCSYTICVVLAVIALTTSIGMGAYFACKYMNHVKKTAAKESFNYQTTLAYWTYKWEKSKK